MTKTEQVYGGSLYELAKEENLSGEILGELRQVSEILDQNPDYGRFLSTLSISKEERCGALDEAFGGKIQPYLLNFMKILCENGTMSLLKGCAAEYRARYNADNGIVEVRAVTAIAMNDALRGKLLRKLEQSLQKKVELTCAVDPACVGGVLLELPGRQLDGTVRHRLEDISKLLKTTAI